MKKIPMITIAMMVIAFIAGLICRTTFTNYNNLKYYNVGLIEGEFAADISESLNSEYETSKYIIKVKCTSDVIFSFLRTFQTVEVEKVFKGNELAEGDVINISQSSSHIYFDDMSINMGFVNAMNEGEEYLVFLDNKKKSIEYGIQIYETPETIIAPIFSYRTHDNVIVEPKYEDYLVADYTDVEKNEFFVTSQEGIDKLNQLKEKLIGKYN